MIKASRIEENVPFFSRQFNLIPGIPTAPVPMSSDDVVLVEPADVPSVAPDVSVD